MSENVRACGCAGHGRHRNSCPESGMAGEATAAAAQEVMKDQYGLPVMPDEVMEQFGGDLAAIESYSDRASRPMATPRTAIPSARMLPNISYKGMLVYRHDPAQRFHFTYLEEDGGKYYKQTVQQMRQRGYVPVTLADFFVHSTLRDILVPDDDTANGRLTLGGASKAAPTVIWRQDETNYRKWTEYNRRFSDRIHQTADEQAAAAQDNLLRGGFTGVTVTSTFE